MSVELASRLSSLLRRSHRWAGLALALTVWLLALVSVAWVLRTVNLSDVAAALGHLGWVQILALLALNILLAFTFGWRWWLILRAQGYSIPYPALAGYRLAGFSVSYFTPGPHFGGEPLQIHLIRQRHAVPLAQASASVALDKLLELIVNSSFLLTCILITIQGQIGLEAVRGEAAVFAALLLALPVGFVAALWQGQHPISSLLARLAVLWNPLKRAAHLLRETEEQATGLCREHPWTVVWALSGSAAIGCAMLFEYWLSAVFLGVHLSFIQLASLVTAARIATLLPSPGGLGTLEAGQVWMVKLLELDPALGLGLSILIRARDVLFGLVGLCWTAVVIGDWQLENGQVADEQRD